MKIIYLLLAFTILVACQSQEQKSETPFDQLTALVDQYNEEALQKGNLNSISVAVYRNGQIYHNYYGVDNEMTPGDQSLFEIASISKVFLGSLVARNVVDGRISLQDDIRMYLSGRYENLEFEGTPITIQDLLTHTIGFETPPKFNAVFGRISEGYYQNRPFDYNMDSLFLELRHVTLTHQPGTYYDYNNVGPELAAYILEQVNQQSYKAQLQVFLDELGMQQTYLQEFNKHRELLVKGFDEDNQPAPNSKNPLLGGSAGMITTLPDLVKFMKFQLESDDPLIKEATKKLFEDDEDNVMGYLWQDLGVAEEEGFYYSKTGDANGIKSGLLICPDSNYGQIVIINNQSEAAYRDWATTFNQIETDLIKYPKINLYTKLRPEFLTNKTAALAKYKKLTKNDTAYFNTNLSWCLNNIGYELLYQQSNPQKAIELFEFALQQDPENANLFDSLGEAWFVAKDYEKSLLHYEKSLELNPANATAKSSIEKIKQLMKS